VGWASQPLGLTVIVEMTILQQLPIIGVKAIYHQLLRKVTAFRLIFSRSSFVADSVSLGLTLSIRTKDSSSGRPPPTLL
jgi:hypothetical protein